MSRYKVVFDLSLIKKFIDMLPDEKPDEVYFMLLMARCKDTDQKLPKVKNSEIYGTKRVAKKRDILRFLYEYEIPTGQYTREGVAIEQEHISPYITINPRSLTVAAKETLFELSRRLIDNPSEVVDPISISMREIHRAMGSKNFLDFDFDNVNLLDVYEKINPIRGRAILKTKGGFHLICPCESVGSMYNEIVNLGCDIHGSKGMIPIPGCCQRGFIPYFYGDI